MVTHRRKTPPKRDAFRHSGGDNRRWTSATVTLYLEVELRRERRPGTEQNTSAGLVMRPLPSLMLGSRVRIPGEQQAQTSDTD